MLVKSVSKSGQGSVARSIVFNSSHHRLWWSKACRRKPKVSKRVKRSNHVFWCVGFCKASQKFKGCGEFVKTINGFAGKFVDHIKWFLDYNWHLDPLPTIQESLDNPEAYHRSECILPQKHDPLSQRHPHRGAR